MPVIHIASDRLQIWQISRPLKKIFRSQNCPYGVLRTDIAILLFALDINNNSIREYASTLYVGLARDVSPTNTNFQLTFLLTRLQEALYEDLAE